MSITVTSGHALIMMMMILNENRVMELYGMPACVVLRMSFSENTMFHFLPFILFLRGPPSQRCLLARFLFLSETKALCTETSRQSDHSNLWDRLLTLFIFYYHIVCTHLLHVTKA